MQPELSIFSPAKINLHLAVKERRSDGFFNLESIFLALDFGDFLHFEPISKKNTLEISMEASDPNFKIDDIPVEKNIIFKAVSLFRAQYRFLGKGGFFQGFKIRVKKRIPLGGGLGGGSSNAASALLAMNAFAKKHIGSSFDKPSLLEMAAALGSDVPFFIHQIPAAAVSDRGEHITPIEPPDYFLVLVNPGFHSDTAAAFQLLAKKRHGKEKIHSNDKPLCTNISASLHLCGSKFFNDFLTVFPEEQKKVYEGIITQLQSLGAEYANLSGAGASCFGVFQESGQAKKAADEMRKAWGFSEFCTVNRNFILI